MNAAAAAQRAGRPGARRARAHLRAACASAPARGRARRTRARCRRCAATTSRAGRGLVQRRRPGRRRSSTAAAEGLAGLAAFGALPAAGADPVRRRPGRGASCAARPRAGAEVVVTRLEPAPPAFVPEFAHQNLGATLAADEPLDKNFATIDPFADRGSDAQTVAAASGRPLPARAELGRAARVPRVRRDRGVRRRPRHGVGGRPLPAPAGALDRGRLRQAARRALRGPPAGARLERHGQGGRRRRRPRKGGPRAHPVPVGLHDVPSLRITITKVRQPRRGPARQRRLPRDRDPRRPRAPGAAAARARRARAARA